MNTYNKNFDMKKNSNDQNHTHPICQITVLEIVQNMNEQHKSGIRIKRQLITDGAVEWDFDREIILLLRACVSRQNYKGKFASCVLNLNQKRVGLRPLF